MTRIYVLSPGLKEYKSRAVELPIHNIKRELSKDGIIVTIKREISESITNCDILIIIDQYFDSDPTCNDFYPSKKAINTITQLTENNCEIFWFDTMDSTGTIHSEVLKLVDKYIKKQLLTNRELYLRPFSDDRIYVSQIRSHSSDNNTQHGHQSQINSKEQLEKLSVGWNIGLSPNLPYSYHLWNSINKIPDRIKSVFPWNSIYNNPIIWKSPGPDRNNEISGRFSTDFDKKPIQIHREKFVKNTPRNIDSTNVSQFAYWQELRNSQVLLSPFGWGEICFRDFEGFMSGCLIIKPSTNHLETWPPLFEDGETVISVRWDADDVEDTISYILDDFEENGLPIAEQAQQRYKNYLIGSSSNNKFKKHFKDIINK